MKANALARAGRTGPRALVKSTVERIATASGATGLARRLRRDRTAIVAYHNVVKPGEEGRGDRSLHLPLPQFLQQVDRLRMTHDIVDLETAAKGAPGARPRAVLTFDDAYRGAVTLALPELAARGLPATVFVAPALLGATSTWWDDLGEADALTAEIRDAALSQQAGRADAVRAAYLPDRAASLPASYGIATEDELLGHRYPGLTLGSHAWAHEHLPSLTGQELRANLGRTLEWLGDFEGPTNRWLALPYGGNSGDTTRVAFELGHEGVLEIRGGLWEPPKRRVPGAATPRINVPAGLSWRGLELRTSGLVG